MLCTIHGVKEMPGSAGIIGLAVRMGQAVWLCQKPNIDGLIGKSDPAKR
jgi:hypothetical protein